MDHNDTSRKIIKSDEEWKRELTHEQYHIMREKGTEAPCTGKYWHSKEDGIYLCAACGHALFSSETKFDSGTGWPSFYKPISQGSVEPTLDDTHGMHRTEVICNRCGAHLGHVFDDGPEPTGKRYCINSISLKLKKKEE